MKNLKYLLIVALVIAGFSASAQWSTNSTSVYYNGGKVGIGTSSPSTLLHVVGTSAPNIVVQNSGGTGGANFTMVDATSGSNIMFKSFSSGTGGFKIRDNTNSLDFMVVENNSAANCLYIKAGGNVGIGTSTPTSKLSVNGAISCSSIVSEGALSCTTLSANGKITTKEVEVTLTGWPDYVFEDEYQLSPLSEVEKYISENKHLPGVSSAQDIEKEGVALGEMNKILMQKVEELTLYVIDLQKQINDLKK